MLKCHSGDLPAIIFNNNLFSYEEFDRTGLFSDLDKSLNKKQTSDSLMYTQGIIILSLTDLVVRSLRLSTSDMQNHSLYVLPKNYRQVTYPAQTRALGYLQSFYVPARIRSLYLIRLRRIQQVGWGGFHAAAGPLPGLHCALMIVPLVV